MSTKVFKVGALTAAMGLSPLAFGQSASEIDQLKQQIRTLEQRVDATAELAESGAGASATTIGGYGELHYNNLDSKKEIDFHRFVLFFGHAFDANTRMFSELEIEHALAGESFAGAVELEQAYVEFDLSDSTRARGGLFLMPVGILNETHEPPTFYGVERNPVEKNIIPTTWWEAGAALNGELGTGLSYDLAVHSGLSTTSYNVRGARQKVAKAPADALAYTGRVKWTGVAGLELAATVNQQSDVTQGAATTAVPATLVETHASWRAGDFGLRALYANWSLEDDGTAAGREKQTGYYVEPSWQLSDKMGLFARYNQWDNRAGDSIDSVKTQTDFGINYWPHPDVVIKADYMTQGGAASDRGFNIGIGYQF